MSVHYYFCTILYVELYVSLNRSGGIFSISEVRILSIIPLTVSDFISWVYSIFVMLAYWCLTVAVLFRIVIIHRKISQLHWHVSPFTYPCSVFMIIVVCPFTSDINTRLRLLCVTELLLTRLYSVSMTCLYTLSTISHAILICWLVSIIILMKNYPSFRVAIGNESVSSIYPCTEQGRIYPILMTPGRMSGWVGLSCG